MAKRKGSDEKFDAQVVADKLTLAKGNNVAAARLLGCSRNTVAEYVKRYACCRAARDSGRCERVEIAEVALDAAVLRGEPWAVTLTLKTLGKEHGYTERQEVTGPDGGPQQHENKVAVDFKGRSADELEEILARLRG